MCVIRKAYVKKRRDAKRRGISFDLSFEEFETLYRIKKCGYTGVNIRHGSEIPRWKKFSLDRVNNNLGYTIDNVIVCSSYVNCVKSDIDSSKYKVKIRVKVTEDNRTEILTHDKNGNKIKRRLVAIG